VKQEIASGAQTQVRDLSKLFYPESIAVIGASADESPRSDGWLGRLQRFGYRGRLYPINPRATQIMGLRSYPSIADVPARVDYAIVAVRAELVAGVLRECVSKDVGVVHVFSGDFADSGNEQGQLLQHELTAIIRGSGTRLIGPNCLGVYCPSGGLTFNHGFSKQAGSLAIVSQTGAALIRILPLAHARGIYCSKVVSYGNAADIDSPELLEYLAHDADTRCVLAYIEGVADGRRFLDAVAKCNREKPVVILKGGLTGGGARAIMSHTATLVGTGHVWKAFFKKTNAIAIDSFDEALNQVVALQFLRPPAGPNVGIVGLGGGLGVVTADICEKAGLHVPALSADTVRSLQTLKGLAVGRGVRNPVEMGLGKTGLFKGFADGLRMLAADAKVYLVMVQLYPEGYVQHWSGSRQMEEAIDILIDTVKSLQKPVATVIGLGHDMESMALTLNAHQRCGASGLAVFATPEAAAQAAFKVIEYYANQKS